MEKAEKKKRFTKIERSWIFYDWANSIYATNISAAIFPIYYAFFAADGTPGDIAYGYAISIANLLVAVLAPMLGGIGDFKGMKKKLWFGFMLAGVIFTATMAFVGTWQLMLIGLIISRIGFSGSCLFYDSFLTDITTPDRMDKVSSWGYAAGYIGGSTIPFVVSIAVMMLLGTDNMLGYKIAILIVPVWWLLFSIPFLKNVHQVHYVDTPPKALAKAAFGNVVRTAKDIFKNKAILFFIIAYFFYIDGVDTIISMATKYGSTLGIDAVGMILALLVTQIVAMVFSILFGNLGRRFGALKMIAVAVCVYFVITILGFFMGFFIDFNEPLGIAYETALRTGNIIFWAVACLVGTVQGGIQALSRSYFGQLIPPERSNEYYGFLDIFGKFSCVIGPALYSLVYGLTGKSSFGILSIILLFLAGGITLIAGRKHFTVAVKAPEAEEG